MLFLVNTLSIDSGQRAVKWGGAGIEGPPPPPLRSPPSYEKKELRFNSCCVHSKGPQTASRLYYLNKTYMCGQNSEDAPEGNRWSPLASTVSTVWMQLRESDRWDRMEMATKGKSARQRQLTSKPRFVLQHFYTQKKKNHSKLIDWIYTWIYNWIYTYTKRRHLYWS